MHLAIVTPCPLKTPGIGHYGYRVSEALAETGRFGRISVLTARGAEVPALDRRPSVTVERVWRQDGADTGPRIGVRLRTLSPDLVWCNLGASVFGRWPLANLSGLLSPSVARSLRIPSVVTMHEVIEDADFTALGLRNRPLAVLGARMITWLMLRGDVTCVTLTQHADRLRVRYPGQRLLHIPHGAFDPPQSLPGAEHAALLHFGCQAPFRGLDLLLRVFSDLHSEFPELRLIVAGADHPRFPGYLATLRREFSRHPAVEWRGFVPTAELRDLFGRASIVVLPYLATTGSSSVLHRAATWGRPVVASDLAEMQAAAEEAGFQVGFFPNGSADGLAQALREFLEDPERRADQVRHNLRAVRKVGLESTCRGYVRALDLALDGRVADRRVGRSASLVREAR